MPSTFHRGETGQVMVGSDVVAVVTSWNATVTNEAYEITTIGKAFREYTGGMVTCTGTIDFIYDSSDDGTRALITKTKQGATVGLKLYVDKDEDPVINTTAFLNSVDSSATVGEIASMTANFTSSAAVTFQNVT